MRSAAVLISLASVASGCSLLFSPDEGGAADASLSGPSDATSTDAGGDQVYTFENGLDPWIEFSAAGGNCSIATDPVVGVGDVVCCTADVGETGAIYLTVPRSTHIEVEFRLLLSTMPGGATPISFSPLAGFGDAVPVGGQVVANVNVYPSLEMGAASIPGNSGPVPLVGPFVLGEWIDVTFELGIQPPCLEVSAEIAQGGGPSGESASPLVNMLSEIEYVELGVFRQASTAGTNTRCFDDVLVRRRTSCPGQ